MKTKVFLDFLPSFTPKSPKINELERKILQTGKYLKKAASLHSETASQRKIIINLKTNKLCNQQKTFLLFILHKLISLIQAVMQSITPVHINLGVDRFIQTLNERIHGLQERRIACNACGNQSVCR